MFVREPLEFGRSGMVTVPGLIEEPAGGLTQALFRYAYWTDDTLTSVAA